MALHADGTRVAETAEEEEEEVSKGEDVEEVSRMN